MGGQEGGREGDREEGKARGVERGSIHYFIGGREVIYILKVINT